MNIALLGGKFDPPHYGHLHIAHQVLTNGPNIDQVLFIPVNTHPWRSIVASPIDRLAMVNLIEESNIKSSPIDIHRGGDTFTIDTVKELLRVTNNSYYWILGSDQLSNLHNWKNYHELIVMIPFLVIPREGYPIKSIPSNFKLLSKNYSATNLSSTEIRDRIRHSLSIHKYVPNKIENYIMKHRLYK